MPPVVAPFVFACCPGDLQGLQLFQISGMLLVKNRLPFLNFSVWRGRVSVNKVLFEIAQEGAKRRGRDC